MCEFLTWWRLGVLSLIVVTLYTAVVADSYKYDTKQLEMQHTANFQYSTTSENLKEDNDDKSKFLTRSKKSTPVDMISYEGEQSPSVSSRKGLSEGKISTPESKIPQQLGDSHLAIENDSELQLSKSDLLAYLDDETVEDISNNLYLDNFVNVKYKETSEYDNEKIFNSPNGKSSVISQEIDNTARVGTVPTTVQVPQPYIMTEATSTTSNVSHTTTHVLETTTHVLNTTIQPKTTYNATHLDSNVTDPIPVTESNGETILEHTGSHENAPVERNMALTSTHSNSTEEGSEVSSAGLDSHVDSIDSRVESHTESHTRCELSVRVTHVDGDSCPQLMPPPAPAHMGTQSPTEQLYIQGLTSATARLDVMEADIRSGKTGAAALQESLASQLQLLQHTDQLANHTQQSQAKVMVVIKHVLAKMSRYDDIMGAMETKLSGLILDVMDMQQRYKVYRDFDDKLHPKPTLVEAPGANTCPGIKNATTYKDCAGVYRAGHTHSGVYYITPIYVACPIPVYCDMDTHPGGWLTIQRRWTGHIDFNRTWAQYRQGFGDVNKDFWLGNDAIFLLTNQGRYELRVDLWDFYGSRVYAQYGNFKIEGERENYTLRVSNHSGSAPDGLSNHAGVAFSTPDRDHDDWDDYHCAQSWASGWWFNNCWFVILTGPYHNSTAVEYRGISWNEWKAEQLKHTEMKIRPIHGGH